MVGGVGIGPSRDPGTDDDDIRWSDERERETERERWVFTKNTAMRHRRVGGRAVTVTAMLHRQRYRVIEKGKD